MRNTTLYLGQGRDIYVVSDMAPHTSVKSSQRATLDALEAIRRADEAERLQHELLERVEVHNQTIQSQNQMIHSQHTQIEEMGQMDFLGIEGLELSRFLKSTNFDRPNLRICFRPIYLLEGIWLALLRYDYLLVVRLQWTKPHLCRFYFFTFHTYVFYSVGKHLFRTLILYLLGWYFYLRKMNFKFFGFGLLY